MTRTALVLVAAVATASLAEAQTVESFDRLALLVNQGDRISVTARNGRRLQGRLVDLSPTTLSLLVDDDLVRLEEAEVSLLRRRHRDSLKNGGVLGLLGGAVTAGVLMADEGPGSNPGAYVLIMSLFGAAGAGIGVGLDAGYEKSQVIYRVRRSKRRLAVAPLLSRHRRGLSVSLGF